MDSSVPADLRSPTGTLHAVAGPKEARRDRNLRRIPLTILSLIVLAGLLGFLGVRNGTSEVTADGWTLRVDAPQVIRPALSAPTTIDITHAGGFDRPVTLRIGNSFFPHFDSNAVVPAPSGETGTPDYVDWTFDPPKTGSKLTITFDTRLGPAEMPGVEHLSFAVVDGDTVLVRVQPRMVVLP